MATSGTFTYAASNVDIIEEAYELAGYEGRSSYDSETARRSMNLIFSDWANYGVNLWTLGMVTTDMVASTASYTLSAQYFDIIEAVMEDNTTAVPLDIPMERISYEEYLNLPDKTTTGRPNLYAVQRGRTQLTVYMYPTPDVSTLDFRAWTVRYMEDVGTMSQNPDIPRRFEAALVYRLAYELALKKKYNQVSPEHAMADAQNSRARRQELGQRAGALFDRAREEDSDAASLFIRPKVR